MADRGVDAHAEALTVAARTRLDLLLVERGLAPSRERARALILAGHVRVNGRPESKAGTPVPADAEVTLDHTGPSLRQPRRRQARPRARRLRHRSRRAARRSTSARRRAASPTCCCGAARRRVIALDVGHGQLDWTLRNDPRVLVREHVNARALTPTTCRTP